MRFLLRHPLLILFLIAVAGLSFAVFNTLQQSQSVTATSGPGGFGGAGGPGGPRGPGGPGAGRGGTNVTVALVSRQIIADRIESVGTASANESLNITAKVSETVSKVHFSDGEVVRQGHVLVELTNAAEASRLAESQANADDARRQFERLQGLAAANLVSKTELDTVRTAAEAAGARLEGVMVAMDDRLIRAPFTGILGFRNVSEGTLVTPGTVITTLDDISTIKLDFNIAEIYLADVHVSMPIAAQSIVYPGQVFNGEVQVVGSRIDPATRSVAIRAHIDNEEGLLRPGMLLTVFLALNAHEVTVIPEQAVVPRLGRQFVFMVDEENIARELEVQLGRRRPGLVEVISGVEPGQRVVTQGLASVRPGQAVTILNSGGSTTGATSTNNSSTSNSGGTSSASRTAQPARS